MTTFCLVLNTAYSDAPEEMKTAEVIGLYDTQEEAKSRLSDFEEGIREDDCVLDTISSANSVCLETKVWVYYAKVVTIETLVRQLLCTLDPDIEPKELDTVFDFAFGIAASERDLVDSLMEHINKRHLVPVF